MRYSVSSSNSTTTSQTYGINSNTKTIGGQNINVKSGLTLTKTDNGPFKSASAVLSTASFTGTSSSGKTSLGISAPKVGASGGVVVGGFGGSASAKASLTEVSASTTFNVLGAKVTISGEAGVGVAIGGKAGVGSNGGSLGAKMPVAPGVYVGANIDVKL